MKIKGYVYEHKDFCDIAYDFGEPLGVIVIEEWDNRGEHQLVRYDSLDRYERYNFEWNCKRLKVTKTPLGFIYV